MIDWCGGVCCWCFGLSTVCEGGVGLARVGRFRSRGQLPPNLNHAQVIQTGNCGTRRIQGIRALDKSTALDQHAFHMCPRSLPKTSHVGTFNDPRSLDSDDLPLSIIIVAFSIVKQYEQRPLNLKTSTFRSALSAENSFSNTGQYFPEINPHTDSA